MQLLAFAFIFCFAILGSTVGHQCNECADKYGKCSILKPVTCLPLESQKYCGTITVVNENGETQMDKSCVPNIGAACKPGVAVDVTDHHPTGMKSTFHCCEGNLCNSSNKFMGIN